MLGWINKKIGTQQGGGSGSGDGGSSTSRGAASPTGDDQQYDQQQRGLPVPPRSSAQRSRGSFLDAVGGAMGRTSRKKDDRSEADARAEQLNAQRAERISCVAFKLVREIQRILKEARETQVVAAGAVRTPAATPPPPARGGAGAGSATEAAAAASSEAGAKRNRWAGTEELLALLDGGSPGGSGEVEDKVERFGSMAEVQAKMSDLVEQALVPESHGDLCGILLEAAGGDGNHPAFVKLCVDAGLPSNLVHCLRIMRVVEFESAMHDSDNNAFRGPAFVAGEEGVDESTFAAGVGEASGVTTSTATATSAVPSVEAARDFFIRPLTERATERIGRLLVTLCRDKSAGVGEQIKPHLPGLLSLAVSAYPPNGAHVQETARAVVEALMGGCLSSSMVWLLHYNKVGYLSDRRKKVVSCVEKKCFLRANSSAAGPEGFTVEACVFRCCIIPLWTSICSECHKDVDVFNTLLRNILRRWETCALLNFDWWA